MVELFNEGIPFFAFDYFVHLSLLFTFTPSKPAQSGTLLARKNRNSGRQSSPGTRDLPCTLQLGFQEFNTIFIHFVGSFPSLTFGMQVARNWEAGRISPIGTLVMNSRAFSRLNP